MLGVSEAKAVPGWTGVLSSTEKSPLRLAAIDYYPVINHPITEYKTVQECLRFAEEASKRSWSRLCYYNIRLGSLHESISSYVAESGEI